MLSVRVREWITNRTKRMPVASRARWRRCFTTAKHGQRKPSECKTIARKSKSYRLLPKKNRNVIRISRRSVRQSAAQMLIGKYDLWRASKNIEDPTPVIFNSLRKYRQSAVDVNKFKVLGTGATGCAISPATPCDNSKPLEEDMVVKYFSGLGYEEKDMEGYRLVSLADPNHEFTIRITHSCRMNNDDFVIANMHCGTGFGNSLIQTMSKGKGNPAKIVMDNAGKTVIMPRDKPTFTENFQSLLTILLPVLKGLVSLRNSKVIHADIKPLNITISEKTHRAKLIDYGLTTTHQDILRDNVYETLYRYWPPEWRMLMGPHGIENADADVVAQTLRQKYSSQDMQVFADPDFLKLRKAIETFHGTVMTKGPHRIIPGIPMDESTVTIFAFYYVFPAEIFQLNNGVQTLGGRILDTWDVYGMGYTIYELIARSAVGMFAPLGNLPEECQMFIYGMTHPNPFHRMLPEQVLEWVMEFLA